MEWIAKKKAAKLAAEEAKEKARHCSSSSKAWRGMFPLIIYLTVLRWDSSTPYDDPYEGL